MAQEDIPETVQDYVEKATQEGLDKIRDDLAESFDLQYDTLQKQINALDTYQKGLQALLQVVRRRVTQAQLDTGLLWKTRYLLDMRNNDLLNPELTSRVDRCISRTRELYSMALGQLSNSDNPESVYDGCEQNVQAAMMRFGFGDFYGL